MCRVILRMRKAEHAEAIAQMWRRPAVAAVDGRRCPPRAGSIIVLPASANVPGFARLPRREVTTIGAEVQP